MESLEINPSMCGDFIFQQRNQGNSRRKGLFFQQMTLEKLDIHMQKVEQSPNVIYVSQLKVS